MVQLTKKEVEALIQQLAEVPAKYSFNLIAFLNQKLTDASKSEESKEVQG